MDIKINKIKSILSVHFLLKLLCFCIGFFLQENSIAQSVKTNQDIYQEGEPIIIDYTGGTGNPKDWIGIYTSGQIPGQIASTIWKYIPNKAGSIEFENTLNPGIYDIHLLCCDGYSIIASQKSIRIERRLLFSRLKHYLEDDSVFITIYNPVDNKKLTIYRNEDIVNGLPKTDALPVSENTTSIKNNESSVKIKIENLPQGNYYAFYNAAGFSFPEIFDINPLPAIPENITRIGLGSCSNHQTKQKVLSNIFNEGIDLFMYLGDNLYIDTYEENVMKFKYEDFLTNRTEFQKLRSKVPIIATWDDHDYGCCDEGAFYALKRKSQKIFLDFYREPIDSKRRSQEGIYTSYIIGDTGKKIQIILLDTRFFLDNKKPNNGCGINDYCPWDVSDTKSMLGDKQWQWLKEELLKPADLRMIASSVQFSSSYHGFESWTLFPQQQQKMLELIKETKAQRVFFVSGDMHYSEVSSLQSADLYPIYDFTCSAINQSWTPEANINRVENNVFGNPNIGLIDIDWQNEVISMKTFDENHIEKFNHKISFSEIEFVSATFEESNENLKVTSIGNLVKFTSTNQLTGTLKIYTINGQLIQSLSFKNENQNTIPNLQSGSYFYTFEHGKKTIFKGSFVK